MNAIGELNYHELTWTQPRAGKYEFELRAGNEMLATIRWNDPYGSHALAEAANGQWSFDRSGLFHRQIVIREAQSRTPIAVEDASWLNGTSNLVFPDGNQFLYQRITPYWNWHAFGRAWMPVQGEQLVYTELTFPNWFMRRAGRVEITPKGLAIPELSLLVLLGWYISVITGPQSPYGG